MDDNKQKIVVMDLLMEWGYFSTSLYICVAPLPIMLLRDDDEEGKDSRRTVTISVESQIRRDEEIPHKVIFTGPAHRKFYSTSQVAYMFKPHPDWTCQLICNRVD